MPAPPLPTQIKEINSTLAVCMACQRTYGKQGQDLELLSAVFLDTLREFEGNAIVAALKRWLKTSPEFPTPADIYNLLSPKQKFDKAVYLELVKRKKDLNEYSSEYQYIKDYEKAALRGEL